MTLTLIDHAYHRNGIAGVPFDVVRFHDTEAGPMVGVVFREPGCVAVLNLDQLAAGDIAFGSNSWRGDRYEPALRRWIAAAHPDEDTRRPPHHHHPEGSGVAAPEPGETPPLSPDALGIAWAYHNPELDRFPWQVALADGRVVLLSDDLTESGVIFSGGDNRPLRSLVPPALLPPGVLAAVRDAVGRACLGELDELLRDRRQIAQVWGVADVLTVRPDLTDEQAWAVLQRVDKTQDAALGITWDSLEWAAAELFGHGPDADDEEDS